jgi:2-polyprenyl-3-methyl-5-hydroxy-6-metoxy-1,4-benzoquinol methylase
MSMKNIVREYAANRAEIEVVLRDLTDKNAPKSALFEQQEFFGQRLTHKYASVDKMLLLTEISRDKKVLHIGCCDSPIMNLNANLHSRLSRVASEIVGMDVAIDDLNKMRDYFKDLRFENTLDVLTKERFDIVLIPDVLEHVRNAGEFLEQVRSLNSSLFVFSVPNAFSRAINKNLKRGIEYVHPDHKYYYSPYTLYNSLTETGFKVVALLGYDSIINNLLSIIKIVNPLKSHGVIAICTNQVHNRETT